MFEAWADELTELNIYFIEANAPAHYNYYQNAVVVAESEEAARATHPSDDNTDWGAKYETSWVSSPANVTAKLIGKAAKGIKTGVITASYVNE
jgi:hypothetical protein